MREKERFPFAFNSDCRGQTVFRPVVAGVLLNQPQVPVTLPTFDEVIGQPGVTLATYNDYILSLIQPGRLNVFTIHAEVEGIVYRDLFERFVQKARAQGHAFTPLGTLLPAASAILPGCIAKGDVPGRDGWVAVQK